MSDKTPEQQTRILGATLTNLADRMAAGEDQDLTVATYKFVLQKLRVLKSEVAGS